MRSEQFERVRRNCEIERARLAAAHEGIAKALSSYDPARPWNDIFRLAVEDKDFWDREVTQPAFRILNAPKLGGQPQSDGTAQPNLHTEREPHHQKRGQQPQSSGAWSQQPGQGHQAGKVSKNHAKAAKKTKQSCPEHNSAAGCTNPSCTKLHVCGFCGISNHTWVDCRTRLAGKSRSSGGGGKGGKGKGGKGGKGGKR